MHRVTACKAEDDYKLWIRFDDGLEGSVFLGNLLEIGAFKLWRDVREFEKVSVDPESATVTWEAASGSIRKSYIRILPPGAADERTWPHDAAGDGFQEFNAPGDLRPAFE